MKLKTKVKQTLKEFALKNNLPDSFLNEIKGWIKEDKPIYWGLKSEKHGIVLIVTKSGSVYSLYSLYRIFPAGLKDKWHLSMENQNKPASVIFSLLTYLMEQLNKNNN